MRFVIGTRSSAGARIALAIAASLSATGALAQSCDRYAADAVAQSQEYQNLGCSGGNSDWWRVDPAHHRNWCVSLPAGSSEPAQGMASREAVLQQCRQAQRAPQSRPPLSQRPPVASPPQVQRPAVFEGTVCDRWEVLLSHEDTVYSGMWERGAGFFYRARWTGGGSTFERYVYPLNANLSFWSEDTASNTFFFYYNERALNLQAGQIGGPWEAEAANGEPLDEGVWSAWCLDPLRN